MSIESGMKKAVQSTPGLKKQGDHGQPSLKENLENRKKNLVIVSSQCTLYRQILLC